MTGIDQTLLLVNGLKELTLDLIDLVKAGGKNVSKIMEIVSDMVAIVRAGFKIAPELKDLDANEIASLSRALSDAVTEVVIYVLFGSKFTK